MCKTYSKLYLKINPSSFQIDTGGACQKEMQIHISKGNFKNAHGPDLGTNMFEIAFQNGGRSLGFQIDTFFNIVCKIAPIDLPETPAPPNS